MEDLECPFRRVLLPGASAPATGAPSPGATGLQKLAGETAVGDSPAVGDVAAIR